MARVLLITLLACVLVSGAAAGRTLSGDKDDDKSNNGRWTSRDRNGRLA
jgi:hypothetical protein